MKKLLSLSLAVVMMVCLLAGFTVNARTTDGGFEYYYFSYANIVDRTVASNADRLIRTDITAFPGPTSPSRMYPVNANWYNDTPGGNMAIGYTNPSTGLVNYDNNSGLYYFHTAVTTAKGQSANVDLYVDNGGVYTIWALVPYVEFPRYSNPGISHTDSSFAKYTSGWTVAANNGTAQAIGNEEYDYNSAENVQTVTRYGTTYTEYKNMFYWDKVNVELVPGKNTITLTSTTTNSRIGAMFVTNDNARPSTKFAYIGTYDSWSTAGGGGNSYLGNNIKYFGDGQYHANWQADGFINLREYSDLDAPTVEIDEVNTVITDNTITFDWSANDPKREYVGKYATMWNGQPGITNSSHHTTGYTGNGTDVSTFYADASGIYETRIYENDVLLATFTDGTTSYTFDAPFTGSAYNFKVEVMDRFGNVNTDTAIFTTTGPVDTEAPQWPADAEITVADASFSSTITWPLATDNTQILGYEIYEGAVDPANLIASVSNITESYTFELAPAVSKDIILVAKDRVGLYSTELSATVSSLAGAENFIIRKEHFDLPDPSLRIWDQSNISSAMIERGCLTLSQGNATGYARGRTLEAKSVGAEVTAKIWVDTPGEYTAFMHINQAGYGVHLSLDGQSTITPFGTRAELNDAGATIYKWEKADRTWFLEEGWNEVRISSTHSAGSLSLIYITNGTTVEPNELTYVYTDHTTPIINGQLNTAIYDDLTGPTYAAGNVTVDYDSVANTATINWPAATDEQEASVNGGTPTKYMLATGLQSYKVYVNGKEIGEVDNTTTSFVIDETTLGRALVPGETIKVKVEALDMYGNKSVKELSYEVSKFVIASFDIKNSTGVADSLLLLNDGTVKSEVVLKNVSEAAADIRLAIAIYNADGDLVYGDNIDYTVAADGTNYTATATITGVPTDLTGYTVKAHLWNAGDLSPVSPTWTTITIQ